MAKEKWKPKGDSYKDDKGRQWRWHPGQKKYVRNYGTSPASYVDRKVKGAAKGVFNTYKRVVTSAKSKYDTAVGDRRKLMIGKGTKENPEFITNQRGIKKKNPNYKPSDASNPKPKHWIRTPLEQEMGSPNKSEIKTLEKRNKSKEVDERMKGVPPKNGDKKEPPKEEEPKHWIRTPLEQEMGSPYKGSEASRRDARRKKRLAAEVAAAREAERKKKKKENERTGGE